MLYYDLYSFFFFFTNISQISTVLCSLSYLGIFLFPACKNKIAPFKKCILYILYQSGFSQRSRIHTDQRDLPFSNHRSWLSTLRKVSLHLMQELHVHGAGSWEGRWV